MTHVTWTAGTRKKVKGALCQPQWAVGMEFRENGVIEDTCKHGVGHPNYCWLMAQELYLKKNTRYLGVHGCDGCCSHNPPKFEVTLR